MNTLKVGRSKKAKSLKEEIEFHSDTGKEHPAINVKYYGRFPTNADQLTPDEQEAVWESTVESFWEQAKELAHKHGYSGLFSEGRSGGWLVPFYQTTAEGKDRFYNWPGQGGNLGYPRYPDVTDKKEDKRFRAFRFDIEQLLGDIPAMIEDGVNFQIEINCSRN